MTREREGFTVVRYVRAQSGSQRWPRICRIACSFTPPARTRDAWLRSLSSAATPAGKTATPRPLAPAPIREAGNYAFRWFVAPRAAWPRFLELCASAWPVFEPVYASTIVGLWEVACDADERVHAALAQRSGTEFVTSVLLTRRPNLAMWERSKRPEGEAERAMRARLDERDALAGWPPVETATLADAWLCV